MSEYMNNVGQSSNGHGAILSYGSPLKTHPRDRKKEKMLGHGERYSAGILVPKPTKSLPGRQGNKNKIEAVRASRQGYGVPIAIRGGLKLNAGGLQRSISGAPSRTR